MTIRTVRWLDRTLVKNPVNYTVVTNDEAFHAVLDDLKIPPSERPDHYVSSEYATATTWRMKNREDGQLVAVVGVVIRADADGITHATALCHETAHIWQWICEYIGEDSPSPEFEAYAMENICRELFEEYVRQTQGEK
jgi:hypothetical protein